MSRFVKLGFAAALAMVTTVSATELYAQCCNDGCGTSVRACRVGVLARVRSRRNCCPTPCNTCNTCNTCNSCATVVAPVSTCCTTSVACCSTPRAGRFVSLRCNTNCCNTGCYTGMRPIVRRGCNSCNTCCASTPCGGCAGCANGQIMQGTSEGGIVVPEATGEPVAPAPAPAKNDT